MLLRQRAAAHGVVLGVFYTRGLGVGALVGADLLIGGQHERALGRLLRYIGRAADIAHIRYVAARGEAAGNLNRRVLAHAVDEEVGPGVENDAAAHLVLPVVVVGEAPEARLERAYDHGEAGEGLARAVRVYGDGAVGAQARFAAGRVEVLAAGMAARRVVRDHAVEVARAYHDAEARPAHGAEGLRAVPVRLAEHRDAEALGLEHAGYNRRAEARVVDIRVAADDEEIVAVPAAGGHVLRRDRQEITSVHTSSPKYQPDTPSCLTR